MKVSSVASTRDVRDHMIDALRRELIGPSPGFPLVQYRGKDHPLNGQEILRQQDPPRYRYSAGILFPAGVKFSATLDASQEAADIEASRDVGSEGVGGVADEASGLDQPAIESGMAEDRAPDVDIEVDPTSSFLPSTMGLSFLADVGAGIRIEASWGTYHKEFVKDFPGYRKDGRDPELWFRTPGTATEEIAAADIVGVDRIMRPTRIRISPPDAHGQLDIDIVSRPWDGRRRLITVTLVNSGTQTRPINENCFFQCEMSIVPLDGTSVLPYQGRPASLQDDEERSLALLYRHRPNFAVGHGCSADWSLSPEGNVLRLRTETLPVFSQPPVLPLEEAEGVELSMRRLGLARDAALFGSCRALAKAYDGWIANRASELAGDASLEPDLRRVGEKHLDECRACLVRMIDGIDLLERDADALEAFRIMNLAMVEQRAHYALASEDKFQRSWLKGPSGQEPSAPCPTPGYPDSTRWRPFQLAFILMNIRSFVDPTHPERALVDVIWFPTGGGKTEAYLGLAAFVILLRRLRTPNDAGATVLMRYTLRLLTTQQFQRAASLICALEKRRRAEPTRFGDVPISIGLWLGGAVTPNKDDAAVDALSKLKRDGGDNPFVILRCPWCGVDMGPQDYDGEIRAFGYKRDRSGGLDRVAFRCEDPGCAFSGDVGLPLEVVDEGIYRQPPTLLIGTVDKFAMMPWNPEARLLFGRDNPQAATPPELVIQDELHLISGPLGSMVGHYETLIDEFSTAHREGKRIPAKIVASTATIARAAEQVHAVYGRKSALFPPQGLVAGESFFAREGDGASGRTYVGVLATAVPSHVTAQVRTLSALLQASTLVDAASGNLDDLVDPYWTLVVYFNSLRELGRASTLVQADIREYLNAVWDRIGLPVMMSTAGAPDRRRFINNFDELTSRMRSSEIPATLQKLFRARPSRDAVDLCYATNMIQVGLDVPRLSLMSIVGQPKGASEYIQASSRVGRGRDKPGLVVTNYNPFKPRDRSHFETFRSFHENAYRHVEPTSVTPFSIPVCERAIHAPAVAVTRFRFPHLRDSPRLGLSASERAEVTRIVMDRVRLVDPAETARAQATLDRFLDDWDRRKPQDYGSVFKTPDDPLIHPAGRAFPAHLSHLAASVRETATSMRNVDADCEATPITVYTTGDEA
ncbi:helicase-related protein [Salinarimonas chemoclinalis]|uniref:helicase-related protein n=1 Tax=Salinarimonas chemoclinalis TaxID=3241599 RepID=UPI0035592E7C